ncbi:major facilitator superfamily domain-containing protein [Aspergillus minisclerotigenes]|uniref:Major facilitator superfamily domain-containing protein n=1 Tax=Aspergillus minisclerotigenes TaxID=656917 RepID=A0A5N6JKT3_9EURO|nr:major facilitator superfamily domain-containing protein [Aspergillus minisclerotigenes]
MKGWIRGSILGDTICLLLGSRWLSYPEDDPTFDFRQIKCASCLDEHCHRNLESGQETFRYAEKLSTANKADESLIIDWYTPDDPENPLNWSLGRKAWVIILISVYTFIVYCGSSIFIPSYEFMMRRYGVSLEVVQLTLAIYVVGYGVGPLIFSPLSEIARIGRNPPYVLSFILFVIVSIILAVIDNFPAIVVLRFLQGFFGSPSLASGGASIQDLFSLIDAPYGFISWVTGFYCGPALGPLLAAYAVTSDWRWPLWEIVLMGAPLLLVIVCLLPETSHETILLRRAQRLRRFHPAVLAPTETKRLDFKAVLIDALIKPIEIAVKDPAITYMCVYSALVYAIFYSFFEAFPIAYGGIYQMPQTTLSLIYLSLIVGCALAAVLYAAYLKYIFIPRCHNGNPSQEARLIPALAAVWLLTAGLFMFAWAARRSVHWIVPTVGIAIYSGSSFVVFQAIIVYIPLSYPRYVASLYAASDFTRSIIAAGFVMFARYMYLDLGIGKGVTVLAGLSVGGTFGMIFIYLYGARLRARSKFAVGD